MHFFHIAENKTKESILGCNIETTERRYEKYQEVNIEGNTKQA
jgi:hypothetical protein